MSTVIDRARAYADRLEKSIQGSGGSAACFHAALVFVKGFALCERDALTLLREWNGTHADPAWTDAELRHKLKDAAKSSRPDGYLLQEHDRAKPNSGKGVSTVQRVKLVIGAA
jgi:hypothetical protein